MKIEKKTCVAIGGGAVVLLVIAEMAIFKNANRADVSSLSPVPSHESSLLPASSSPIPEEPTPGASVAQVVAAPVHAQMGVDQAMLNAALELKSAFNLGALRSAGLPLVIDFGADSCVPCKEMAPVLVDLHASLKGKAIIHFVDVWKYRTLADGYPIQVIPTQFFFDAEGNPFVPDESLPIPFTQYRRRDSNENVFTPHEGGLDKAQLLAILSAMGMKK